MWHNKYTALLKDYYLEAVCIKFGFNCIIENPTKKFVFHLTFKEYKSRQSGLVCEMKVPSLSLY